MIQPDGRDLPAILLGWAVQHRYPLPAGDKPAWLVAFIHNYGGHVPDEYDAIEVMMVGALLPLLDNLRHGKKDLRELVARLEDEDNRETHYHTRDADGLPAPRLAALRETFAGYLRLPEVESATEALVMLVPGDPLNHFERWAVHPVGDARVFDETLASELAAAGRALALPGPPRTFLLWWNCGL